MHEYFFLPLQPIVSFLFVYGFWSFSFFYTLFIFLQSLQNTLFPFRLNIILSGLLFPDLQFFLILLHDLIRCAVSIHKFLNVWIAALFNKNMEFILLFSYSLFTLINFVLRFFFSFPLKNPVISFRSFSNLGSSTCSAWRITLSFCSNLLFRFSIS